MLKITKIAEDVAKQKTISEEAKITLQSKIDEFMNSEEIKELDKIVQDSVVEYDDMRDAMLKEMQKQTSMSIKTESGIVITRSISTKVKIDDQEKVIAFFEKSHPEFVNTKKSLKLLPAKKYIMEELELGNKVDGAGTENVESIMIKTPKND